jgi:hypothetical protein
LLCFVYVGLKQNCEALQLLRISELHELHFALSNQCHQDKAFLKRSLNIQKEFASIGLSCPIKWR